ncbi:hypothetical protein CKAH01_10157 [Colletotrichum kahawae]|uniref:J domain-containing protein n=1 Tax=Colletotrichum kahawae TaxID=34407 RepID=A0AAD9XWG6_COLKA|nr:hypothetical protein CKAH01_10157 [Colletotrichum kahawae]
MNDRRGRNSIRESKVIGITYNEIRKAYRQAGLHYHDDKIHQRAPGTQNAFSSMTQVNIARDFLLRLEM